MKKKADYFRYNDRFAHFSGSYEDSLKSLQHQMSSGSDTDLRKPPESFFRSHVNHSTRLPRIRRSLSRLDI